MNHSRTPSKDAPSQSTENTKHEQRTAHHSGIQFYLADYLRAKQDVAGAQRGHRGCTANVKNITMRTATNHPSCAYGRISLPPSLSSLVCMSCTQIGGRLTWQYPTSGNLAATASSTFPRHSLFDSTGTAAQARSDLTSQSSSPPRPPVSTAAASPATSAASPATAAASPTTAAVAVASEAVTAFGVGLFSAAPGVAAGEKIHPVRPVADVGETGGLSRRCGLGDTLPPAPPMVILLRLIGDGETPTLRPGLSPSVGVLERPSTSSGEGRV